MNTTLRYSWNVLCIGDVAGFLAGEQTVIQIPMNPEAGTAKCTFSLTHSGGGSEKEAF